MREMQIAQKSRLREEFLRRLSSSATGSWAIACCLPADGRETLEAANRWQPLSLALMCNPTCVSLKPFGVGYQPHPGRLPVRSVPARRQLDH